MGLPQKSPFRLDQDSTNREKDLIQDERKRPIRKGEQQSRTGHISNRDFVKDVQKNETDLFAQGRIDSHKDAKIMS